MPILLLVGIPANSRLEAKSSAVVSAKRTEGPFPGLRTTSRIDGDHSLPVVPEHVK
jgi:hypothetical protein